MQRLPVHGAKRCKSLISQGSAFLGNGSAINLVITIIAVIVIHMNQEKEPLNQARPAGVSEALASDQQPPLAHWWPQVRAAFGSDRAALAPRQRIYWRKREHEVQPAVLLRYGVTCIYAPLKPVAVQASEPEVKQ